MINIMFYLHDITEKLLKVVLNTIIPTLTHIILANNNEKEDIASCHLIIYSLTANFLAGYKRSLRCCLAVFMDSS